MNSWEQDEIDRAAPSEQARADLEAIRDQIDAGLYKMLLGWIDRGESDVFQRAQEKIDFLVDFHRMTWGRVDLPEEGSGHGLDEIR